ATLWPIESSEELAGEGRSSRRDDGRVADELLRAAGHGRAEGIGGRSRTAPAASAVASPVTSPGEIVVCQPGEAPGEGRRVDADQEPVDVMSVLVDEPVGAIAALVDLVEL